MNTLFNSLENASRVRKDRAATRSPRPVRSQHALANMNIDIQPHQAPTIMAIENRFPQALNATGIDNRFHQALALSTASSSSTTGIDNRHQQAPALCPPGFQSLMQPAAPIDNQALPGPIEQPQQDEQMLMPEQQLDLEICASIDNIMSAMMPDVHTLPLTRSEFANCTSEDPGAKLTDAETLVPKQLLDLLDKKKKLLLDDTKESFKVLAQLKKDKEMLKEGKIPRAIIHKNSLQFKKEVKEEFQKLQEQAETEKQKKDFLRKIESSTKWLSKKNAELAPQAFLQKALEEAHDAYVEAKLVPTRSQMIEVKQHFIFSIKVAMEEAKSTAKKSFADAQKSLSEKALKLKQREEKFDTFIAQEPKVVFGVFFRELEQRLLTVVLASKDKAQQEYMQVRKGQQLTVLEESVYKLKDQLSKNEFPCVESKSLEHMFKKRKEKDKDKEKNKKTQQKQKRSTSRKGRSTSKNRDEACQQKDRKKSGSRPTSKKSNRGRSKEVKKSGSRPTSQKSSRGRSKGSAKSTKDRKESSSRKSAMRGRSTTSLSSKSSKGASRTSRTPRTSRSNSNKSSLSNKSRWSSDRTKAKRKTSSRSSRR